MTASLTFIGNATTVLQLGGFTLLTDPNFIHRGQRAYLGKGLWSRRLTDPALGIGELPPVMPLEEGPGAFAELVRGPSERIKVFLAGSA